MALFRRYALTPVQFTCGLGVPGNIAVPDDLFEPRLRALPELAELARAIGCGRASLFVDEQHTEGAPIGTAPLAKRIRRIADTLAQAGLELSLGPDRP